MEAKNLFSHKGSYQEGYYAPTLKELRDTIHSVLSHCLELWVNCLINSIAADRKRSSTHWPDAFRLVHTGIETPFLLKYIMWLLLVWLRVALPLTNREMVSFQKFNFLRF